MTGRVYLEVFDTNGNLTIYGTSINGPGPYTIRGVLPGTYNLVMHMDTLDNGVINRVNPRGTVIDVSVFGSNITSVDVTLSDPALPASNTFASIAPPVLFASDSAVIISWDSVFDFESVGVSGYLLREEFDHYRIHYFTDVGLTIEVFVDEVKAGFNFFIRSGLINGDSYFITLSGLAQGVESAQSAATEVTVGASGGVSSGGNTVTGSVTFPSATNSTLSGTLLVALLSDTQGLFFDLVTTPTSPQGYSISGVPDGDYVTIVAIDDNKNGVIDFGELFNGALGQVNRITVNAGGVSHDLVAVEQASFARLSTLHWLSGQQQGYDLEFSLYQGMKQPIKVALVSGPYISDLPVDFSHTLLVDQPYYAYLPLADIRPAVGDSYTFDITYNDSSSESLVLQLSAVLDSFAIPTYPLGTDSGDLVPLFSWIAPASPPLNHQYGLLLSDNLGSVWESWNMPGAQTAVSYNNDGLSVLPSLVGGEIYYWSISVLDNDGNSALNEVSYTP